MDGNGISDNLERKLGEIEKRLVSVSDAVERFAAGRSATVPARATREIASGSPVDSPEQPRGSPTSDHRDLDGCTDISFDDATFGGYLFERLLERIVQGRGTSALPAFSADEFDELFAITSDIVVLLDAEAFVLDVNTVFCRRFRYSRDEIRGSGFYDLVVPEYHLAVKTALARTEDHARGSMVPTPDDILVFRAMDREGRFVSLECVFGFIGGYACDGAETDGRRVAVLRDVSLHHSLIEQLKQSRDNYDALSETITEAIFRLDERLTIVFANSAVKRSFGYDSPDVIGQPFSVLFPAEVYERHKAAFLRYFVVDDPDRARLGMENSIELLGRHKNRGVVPMELSFGNSRWHKGRTLTCIARDITQRKTAERRLRHLAYHDQLTDLGNRDLFLVEIQELLRTFKGEFAGKAALFFMDLDGFKQVNDTLGHDAGDLLLVETAKRLRATLRESDSVYRFGGDEFVVLINFMHDTRGAEVVASNILAVVRRPYQLQGNGGEVMRASVGVSVGVAMIPDDGTDVATLTKNADLAMYSAKEGGKNRFAFYSPELDARAYRRWQLEQGLKAALENNDFFLKYQPLVDQSGSIKGIEALLRWDNPDPEAAMPGTFIPAAEQTGLIVPLGLWVLETAFRDTRRLNESGYPDLYVCVNISARQFTQKDFVEMVARSIDRSEIRPKNVKVEITETCIMAAPEEATEKMSALRARFPGIEVAIDDFGTGYSSLSYLSRLPVDIIKIDLSFVTELFAETNEKIVHAIIDLAHSLELELVAEGVETREQWAYFKRHDCRTLQGFLFSRAVVLSELRSLLKSGRLPISADDHRVST